MSHSLLLVSLYIVILIAISMYWRARKKAFEARVESLITSSPKKTKRYEDLIKRLAAPASVANQKPSTLILVSAASSIAIGLFTFYFLSFSWLLGAIVGAVVPYLILVQMKRSYEMSFRTDGKKALELLGAIVTSGGTLEEWLQEALPRLDGPLAPIFKRGINNLALGVPITLFLEQLQKHCPDSYLQMVFSGILHEHRNSGDLPRFVDEVMKDMVNQERFERAMRTQRIQAQQMLMYLGAFPLFLYFLFENAIDRTMRLHPTAMIVFIIGAAGYVGFYWYGLRVTRSRV